MIITLKNIKHSEFASQETNCFEATVYVDGKRSFITSNQGTGGCDDYRPFTMEGYKAMREQIEAINAELKLIPLTGDYADLTNDLEIAVGDCLTEWLINKDIKKNLKKVCWVNPEGETYTSKAKPTQGNLQAIKNASWWTPEHKLLNGLPMVELRKYFK